MFSCCSCRRSLEGRLTARPQIKDTKLTRNKHCFLRDAGVEHPERSGQTSGSCLHRPSSCLCASAPPARNLSRGPFLFLEAAGGPLTCAAQLHMLQRRRARFTPLLHYTQKKNHPSNVARGVIIAPIQGSSILRGNVTLYISVTLMTAAVCMWNKSA